jgi:GT2 family glycosyltransferase
LIFERPVFDRLINSLNANHASLIAPVIVDERGTPQDSFRTLPAPIEMIRRRLPGYTFTPLKPDDNGMIHPDWIAGMFWLMRSDTYRDLTGMDEKFFLYLEDVDFCTRARLRGMKILVDSNIQIIHNARRSSRKSLKYLFMHIQSAILFFTSSVYRQALRKF